MNEIPEVLRTYIAGLKAHDIDAIAATVVADLAFVTPTRTLDNGQFLQMLRALYAAFPDWHYDHDEPEWRGDVIAVRWRQGGLHTGAFVLPGLTPVPATSRRVTIPAQHFFYRVRGNEIVEIRPEPIPGGAPRGILEQRHGGAALTVLAYRGCFDGAAAGLPMSVAEPVCVGFVAPLPLDCDHSRGAPYNGPDFRPAGGLLLASAHEAA